MIKAQSLAELYSQRKIGATKNRHRSRAAQSLDELYSQRKRGAVKSRHRKILTRNTCILETTAMMTAYR